VFADLMAEIPVGERHAEAARVWLAGVLGELFGDLREGLRVNPSTRKISKHWDDGPEGEPGQTRGELSAGDMPRRARTVTFTEASWQRFLGGLSTSPPFASLSISVVGEDGYHSAEAAEIWVRRFEDEPCWVRFTFWAPYRFTWRDRSPGSLRFHGPVATRPGPGGGWVGSADLQDQWATTVRSLAARVEACAGMVTARGGGPGPQEDVAYPDWPPENVLQPPEYVQEIAMLGADRDVLYRYAWVTIIPPELAARLGGAATLTSSGAFVDVSELPGGSVWLRATRTIEEFDNARSSAVAEALAPVLVTAKVL
jgi:hypothetical protein